MKSRLEVVKKFKTGQTRPPAHDSNRTRKILPLTPLPKGNQEITTKKINIFTCWYNAPLSGRF
jgi:hypothetical protein